jgi:DNA topoisomerase-3
MKLVIAEKPSVGRELAKVMGATVKKNGYIEGNGYIFTWAYGHLVELAMPNYYGYNQNGWTVESLPMLPNEFKLVISQVKNKKTNKFEADSGAKQQLEVIKGCMDKASSIIVATDAGREGELIFRYIYHLLDCKKPFQRLWISSQTDKAIKDGFANLKDGRSYDTLYYSAKARSESDWLIGMNATQALTLSAGTLCSIGRVQTPTLAIICQRYLDNKDFVPSVYYQIALKLEKNAVVFTASSVDKFTTKEQGENIVSEIKRSASVRVTKVDKKEKIEPVPLLFDLGALQQEANKKLSLSAEKTLDIAQKLYESKLITYPRTGSKYIGEDVFKEIPRLIDGFTLYAKFSAAAKHLSGIQLNKRSVNAEKVTDHHALLPTEIIPTGLAEEELLIYEMIVSRTLESFHESCIKEVTTVEFEAVIQFVAKGTVINYLGWRSVLNEVENEEGENTSMPKLLETEKVPCVSMDVLKKQTQPKPLYTEGTLLKAMETAGREIEDEQAREAMKDCGLGTAATRAAIITVLFDRNYIELKKKSLIPTNKGLSVYQLVKDKDFAKPKLTGDWEKKLADIEKGSSVAVFTSQIKDYTIQITKELLDTGKNVKVQQEVESLKSLPVCPRCQVGHVKHIDNEKLNAWVCTQDREKCGFIIYGELLKKKLSDTAVKQLLSGKKTAVIKGFVSAKTGKPFDASLKLDDHLKVVFDFS